MDANAQFILAMTPLLREVGEMQPALSDDYLVNLRKQLLQDS